MKKFLSIIILIFLISVISIISVSAEEVELANVAENEEIIDTGKKEIEIIDDYAYRMGEIIVSEEDSFVYFNSDCYKVEAYSGKAEAYTGNYDGRYYENGKNNTRDNIEYKVTNGIMYTVYQDGTSNKASGFHDTIVKSDDVYYTVKNDGSAMKFTGVKDGKFYKNGVLDTTDSYMEYQGKIYSIDKAGNATIYKKDESSAGTYQSKIKNVVYDVNYNDGSSSLYSGVYNNTIYKDGIVDITKSKRTIMINDLLYSVESYGKATKFSGIYEDLLYKSGILGNGFVTVDSKTYYAENGVRKTGYQTINKLKYYFNSSGVLLKNMIVGTKEAGYYFADSKGVVCTSKEMNLAVKFVMKHCGIKVGSKLTLTQLHSVFMYMAHHIPYNRTYDHPKKASDVAALAIDMFTKEKGNCFRYAACFAEVCKMAGYETRVVIGDYTIGGNAWTPHGWTEIKVNGVWYLCDVDMEMLRSNNKITYMVKKLSSDYRVKTKCTLTIVDGKCVWK